MIHHENFESSHTLAVEWNNDRTSESSWNTGIDLKKEAILFSCFEGTTPDTAGYNSVVE